MALFTFMKYLHFENKCNYSYDRNITSSFPQEKMKLTNKSLKSEVLSNCVLCFSLTGFLYHKAWHFFLMGGWGEVEETMQFNKIEASS